MRTSSFVFISVLGQYRGVMILDIEMLTIIQSI